MATGTKTQGVTLQLGSAASPPVFSGSIANVSSLTGLNSGTATDIDITALDSTAREFLSGFTDPGSLSVGLNFDEDQPSHITLFNLSQSKDVRDWRIVLPSGSYFEFAASVSAFPFDFNVDDAIRNTVTLRITGQIHFEQA